MLEHGEERHVVFFVIGVNDEDIALSDRKLGIEGAFEERRPHAQDHFVRIDLTIAEMEDNVGVLRIVEDGRVACSHQSCTYIAEGDLTQNSPW